MEKAAVNGVSLAYELTGTGGEALVFLNGIAMSIAHWKPFVDALSADYPCLCHDFRGQLLSDKPKGPYHFAEHVEDLGALLLRLGIERAHLIGTSYGSEVAMLFAATYPAMTASLTVIDGVSELDPLLRAVGMAWKTAALAEPKAFYRSLIPWTYSAAYIAANRGALEKRETAIVSFPRDYFEGFAALCDAFLELDMTAELHRITCPSLVAVGDKDILKHPGYARIIADRIKGSRLVLLPGLGHAGVVEDPAAVIAALRPFLEGAARNAAHKGR